MTDYKELVYEVFESLPFRFMTKPLTKEKLQNVLCDAMGYLREAREFLPFSIENVKYQIAYEDILYLESDRRKIHLHTLSGEYVFYGKLSDVEKIVDGNIFARIHVSYLVNFGHIRKILKGEAELENGVVLPVSRKYAGSLREQQMIYVKWRNGL